MPCRARQIRHTAFASADSPECVIESLSTGACPHPGERRALGACRRPGLVGEPVARWRQAPDRVDVRPDAGCVAEAQRADDLLAVVVELREDAQEALDLRRVVGRRRQAPQLG